MSRSSRKPGENGVVAPMCGGKGAEAEGPLLVLPPN